MKVTIKRVYESAASADGYRVLVDRLWPRGLRKEEAKVDEWLRGLAPSNELRRWYHARPEEWEDFRRKYLKELSQPPAHETLDHLYEVVASKKKVTLLFASKNEERNNATVLQELLGGKRKPPKGTGPVAIGAMRHRAAAARRR